MFYHFKIMLRNLRRGGIYSAINIGGLAAGMATAILFFAWIYHEWSYDRFHAKEKNLYVTYYRNMYDGALQCGNWTPVPLGPILKTDYPGIAGVARMRRYKFLFANTENVFRIHTGCTDPDFLTMFDFPLLSGDRETALNDPYSVILTEKAAVRLFGLKDPLGQTLLVGGEHSITVTGVMKDLPRNTVFYEFEAFTPMNFLKVLDRYTENWVNELQTYVELQPNVQSASVNEAIRGIAQEHSNSTNEFFLYSLNRQHLYSKFENGIPTGVELLEKMRLYGMIAGLILLIACINFTNLSIARSEKRAKEIGVRKVMGGRRLSLVKLFLSESMLVSFVAGIIALCLAWLALPVFSTLMEQQITFDFADGWFWVAGLGFVVLTGLLAGSYPAFYLSSFIPVRVLKGLFRRKQGVASSQKTLVVIQFTVACALIFSTSVIYRQIGHAKNRETGYDKDHLIYTFLSGDLNRNYELIKQDLLNSGTALSVTRNSEAMTAGWRDTRDVDWRGKDPNKGGWFGLIYTDADWTKTVGVTIVAGRDIDISAYPADSSSVLLNEAAVRMMNFENPVGETVKVGGNDWRVVGVVKDFILRSPYEPVEPMLVFGPASWLSGMHIKLNGYNRMADNLARAEQIFKQYNPNYPFDYQFVDEDYARKFREEQKFGMLTAGFAGLTIFISCMGLFALIAYMAETRRKEIGIRKVLGASVTDVVMLLSKEFLMLVAVSILIASPVAWWAMEKWLADYAYRTDIPWWLFVVVGCISLCIALFTVGFQAVRAATANPVEAIKSE